MRLKILLVIFFCLFVESEILARELLTAGYESKPKYFQLENGSIGGLCVEIIQAIAKIDSSIVIRGYDNFKYSSFQRVKRDLETGKIDVYFGFSRNKEREENFIFLDLPLYSMEFVIAVRASEEAEITKIEDFRSFSQEKGNEILTVFGTAASKYIQSFDDLLIDKEALSIESNLKKLLAGRGRFVFFNKLEITAAIKNQKLKDKIKILPTSFCEYNQYVAFSKNVPKEEIDKIRAALQKLSNNGKLLEIYNKYSALE